MAFLAAAVVEKIQEVLRWTSRAAASGNVDIAEIKQPFGKINGHLQRQPAIANVLGINR